MRNRLRKSAIYDDIGAYGVTAKDFIAHLSSIAAPVIRVSINSPGGAVFDALAMFNALRQHPANIEVSIMGRWRRLRASLVAMAGDKITMSDNAFVMIHNPLCYANGNADELRDLADTLDKNRRFPGVDFTATAPAKPRENQGTARCGNLADRR
jgi:ATP-dependent Clp protease protease subunit